jgi:hypothetical protein
MPKSITNLDLVVVKAIRESDRLRFPMVVIRKRYSYEVIAEGMAVPEGFVVVKVVGEKYRL